VTPVTARARNLDLDESRLDASLRSKEQAVAQIHWTHKGNGNWTTASDWSTGTVPGASDDVFIGISGVTVTSDANVTVDSIGTNTNTTLVIANESTFVATNGTGSSLNLGTIKVTGDGSLNVGAGVFENFGSVVLGSTGMYDTFLVDNVVQLEGGGHIDMVAHPQQGGNYIEANPSKPYPLSQIDNVDNDIAGDGFIGDVYFDNQTNGILETSSPLGGGTLELFNSNIAGQGFQNEGHVFADDGGTLELFGVSGGAAFFNFGNFYVDSNGDRTVLEIAGDVVLKGAGNVTLSDNFSNFIDTNGQSARFENVDDVISGSGQVYDPILSLANDAQGKIEAVNADAPLILYTGTNAIANAGLLEATNGALLEVQSPVDDTGTVAANGGNVIMAADLSGTGKSEIFSGSHLELLGSANKTAAVFENNSGDTGTLVLGHSATKGRLDGFKGTVAGLYNDGTHSDALVLQDINLASSTWSFTENSVGKRGVLTVEDANGDTAKITLIGQYLAADTTVTSANSSLFQRSADDVTGTTGTLITTTYHH
jgi:hypothetical protein